MSKRPRRFTGLQVVAMLRSIDEDDSGEESETEDGDVLDWELCISDEISDDEETEQFDDTQPIVHVDDLQAAYTNVETHSATCLMMILVRVLLKVQAYTYQQEIAPNGNLWNSAHKHREIVQLRMS